MHDEMMRQGKSSTLIAPPKEEAPKKEVINPCPKCGDELTFQGGCNVCRSCGWTKCE
jgi:ribonucleoside-diphosphate reductase alpha chain